MSGNVSPLVSTLGNTLGWTSAHSVISGAASGSVKEQPEVDSKRAEAPSWT